MFFSSSDMSVLTYGFDWEATLQEVPYTGSPWGSRNAGSLKSQPTREEVKKTVHTLSKPRRERPPKARIDSASLKNTEGTVFSDSA